MFTRAAKKTAHVEYCHDTARKIQLKVCRITNSGTNCCKCEKCRHTTLALLVETENPIEYGKKNGERAYIESKKIQ